MVCWKMLRFPILLTILFCTNLLHGWAGDAEDKLDFLENCNMAHHLSGKMGIKIVSKYAKREQYFADSKCLWQFIGDTNTNCKPSISCDFVDLRQSDDCEKDALVISDGVGGEQVFCGNKKVEELKAHKGRDIYVEFRSGAGPFDKVYKGFECVVTCNTKAPKALEVTRERKEDSRCVCGLQNQNDRIVGGEDAKMMEFPWQAAIVFKGTRSPKCGASVLNNQWILTAAHCFAFENTDSSSIEILLHARILDHTKKGNAANVALGEVGSIRGSGYNLTKVTDKEEKTQRFKIAQIINHPLFTAKYDFDIALLKLETKIDLSAQDAPTPVCLAPEDNYDLTYEKEMLLVSGWGMPHGDAGATTRVLQKLDVPTIPLSKCAEWMPYSITQRMLCAGYEEGKKDACTGDSGGPLVFNNPKIKQWQQVGIVSWGENCALPKKPGLYSRMTELSQWAHYHMQNSKPLWCKNTR